MYEAYFSCDLKRNPLSEINQRNKKTDTNNTPLPYPISSPIMALKMDEYIKSHQLSENVFKSYCSIWRSKCFKRNICANYIFQFVTRDWYTEIEFLKNRGHIGRHIFHVSTSNLPVVTSNIVFCIIVTPLATILSIYVEVNSIPCITCSVTLWNILGTQLTPYSNMLYIWSPLVVLIVVNSFESSSSSICR